MSVKASWRSAAHACIASYTTAVFFHLRPNHFDILHYNYTHFEALGHQMPLLRNEVIFLECMLSDDIDNLSDRDPAGCSRHDPNIACISELESSQLRVYDGDLVLFQREGQCSHQVRRLLS